MGLNPYSGSETDALRRALRRAADALEADPRILHEKKPEWESGLNAQQINALAAQAKLCDGVVYELTDEREGEEHVVRRLVTVRSPRPGESVTIESWSRYGSRGANPAVVQRALAILREWQGARWLQLRVSESDSWFTLEFLESPEVMALLERDPMQGDGKALLFARAETESLRAACARARLCPWSATDQQVARAARTWMVGVGGVTTAEANRLSVSQAAARILAEAGMDSAKSAGRDQSQQVTTSDQLEDVHPADVEEAALRPSLGRGPAKRRGPKPRWNSHRAVIRRVLQADLGIRIYVKEIADTSKDHGKLLTVKQVSAALGKMLDVERGTDDTGSWARLSEERGSATP